MPSGWLRELRYVLGLAFAALILGLIAGHLILAGSLTLLAYLIAHLVNIYRLLHWLKNEEKFFPLFSVGVWEDISTEIYRLEARTRKQKRKLASAVDRFEEAAAALPDGIVVLGPHGEIEWFNAATGYLLGLRSPQDLGQRIVNLLRHPDFIGLLNSADPSKTAELPSSANSEIIVTIQIVPYGKKRQLLVARDSTHVHRLEQVRRDFVANVSHELRTPLTVLNGYLETLTEAYDECPPHLLRSLELMQHQAERMQHLVTDLLMLSRLEMNHRIHNEQIVAVPDVLATIIQDARELSKERGHSITLDADPTLKVYGNEEELRSAFSNLVFNAVQYTPARGEIAVRWFRDAQGGHMVVRDNGVGIAAHHIPRLTERFYRVDAGRSRESGGTGLGLAIVKHVLNRHAAQLRIESEPGKGSTFSCDFPHSAIAGPAEVPEE